MRREDLEPGIYHARLFLPTEDFLSSFFSKSSDFFPRAHKSFHIHSETEMPESEPQPKRPRRDDDSEFHKFPSFVRAVVKATDMIPRPELDASFERVANVFSMCFGEDRSPYFEKAQVVFKSSLVLLFVVPQNLDELRRLMLAISQILNHISALSIHVPLTFQCFDSLIRPLVARLLSCRIQVLVFLLRQDIDPCKLKLLQEAPKMPRSRLVGAIKAALWTLASENVLDIDICFDCGFAEVFLTPPPADFPAFIRAEFENEIRATQNCASRMISGWFACHLGGPIHLMNQGVTVGTRNQDAATLRPCSLLVRESGCSPFFVENEANMHIFQSKIVERCAAFLDGAQSFK